MNRLVRNRKMIPQLAALLAVVVLASCSAGNAENDTQAKQAQLVEYKQQLHELELKIAELEKELKDSLEVEKGRVYVRGTKSSLDFRTLARAAPARTELMPLFDPDTDRNPYEWQTVASHVTWSCGNAVHAAAVAAREASVYTGITMAEYFRDEIELMYYAQCFFLHRDISFQAGQ